MLLVFVASALLLSIMLRGDVRRLGQVDFRRLPWILASFVLRDASEEVFRSDPPGLASSMLLAFACYGMLFYGLYPNLRLPGMRTAAAGCALNLLVIVLNQGRMPVSVARLTPAQQVQEIHRLATSINHQLLLPGARLPFLADLFKWSFLRKTPALFSVGDILLALGVSWLVLCVSLRRFPASGNDGRIG